MAKNVGRVTIVDVARAAGTSVSTASVALRGGPGVSEQTRSRIVAAAQHLGYQPDQRARLLRLHQSRLLGVTFSINQTFHSAVVENLYRAVAETDYDFVLSATTSIRPQAQAIENLLRDRCETIILISPEIDQAQLEDLTTRASVITLGSDLHAANADSVHSDDRQGITDAVNHLVNLGHHSITYIDGGTSAMSEVRRTAYVDAMEAHGLHEQIRIRTGSPTEESGAEIATLILDEEPLPTAILAHNDMIAFGLLLTLRSRGIAVPGDVSIVGYDDTRIAHLSTVQLTSVSQDTSRLAQTAVRRAITRAEDPGTPPREDFVTPAQLVVRATCGPPRTRRPRQP